MTRARTRTLAILGLSVGIAALAACAGSTGESPAGSSPAATPFTTSAASSAMSEVPSDLVERVVADAAERRDIEPGAVQVLAAEAVTWSDGSLGCPEPGMMYTQALVPGYRVVVAVAGEEMSFHASESGDFRFCENPQVPGERSDR